MNTDQNHTAATKKRSFMGSNTYLLSPRAGASALHRFAISWMFFWNSAVKSASFFVRSFISVVSCTIAALLAGEVLSCAICLVHVKC